MSKPDGGPAYPVSGFREGFVAGLGDNRVDATGITMRDYFAAAAVQGIIASPRAPMLDSKVITDQDFARFAYEVADAMLAERAKP